jgi:hypothetical protein
MAGYDSAANMTRTEYIDTTIAAEEAKKAELERLRIAKKEETDREMIHFMEKMTKSLSKIYRDGFQSRWETTA